MAYTFSSEDEAQVREWVRMSVRGGFTPRETIVDNTIESAEDEFSIGANEVRPFVERIVGEEWEAVAREQILWGGPTDCDRLDQAFANLEKQGIVARQDFTCCSNCGSTEIWVVVHGACQE